MVVILLISGTAWAAEPCAWVLWVEHEWIGLFGNGKGYERAVVPEAAYPNNGYTACVEDAHTRAVREVELSKTAPNIKSFDRVSLMGSQQKVTTELRSGGWVNTKYMCFPHPVKPQ